MQRGSRILTWSLVAVGVVVGGGVLVGSGIGLWMYMNHDRYEFIDDPVVEEVIATGCRTMTDEVRAAAVQHDSAVSVRVAAARRQNQAIWDFLEDVYAVGDERLDGDLPSRRWLDDWKSIMSVRERAVVELAAGLAPSYAVPTVEGNPVTRRMNEASSCQVPVELTTLP